MDPTVRSVLPLLPVLATFAETGLTNATADLLQIPQSTVSRTLARIGTVVGTPVVKRHGRTLELTPAGLALVPYAATVVSTARVGVEAVRDVTSRERGPISLAFQGTLGERVVPALVRSFLADHPGARVELNQVPRLRCLEVLGDGSAEIALVSPPPERTDLVSLPLHTEPLVLIVPPGHHLAHRANISFAEAAAETFICVKSGFGLRTYLDNLSVAAGFDPKIDFEGDDLATVRGLVSAGLGVGLTPRDPHGAPGCVEVSIIDRWAYRTIGACWKNQTHSSLASAFHELLRQRGPRLTEIGLRPLI